MLTIDRGGDGILRIFADGKLAPDDYASFVPPFEHLAADAPPILIELGPDFAGWTLAGLREEIRFDATHLKNFGPIAIVGDKAWERWGTELSNLLFPGEIRFFDPGGRDEAVTWLGRKRAPPEQ